MGKGQFRFAYFTPDYESTVAFFRDGVGLPVLSAWDRSPDDRGTIFGAASGMIEVLQLPRGGEPSHVRDLWLPHGASLVIEVDQLEARYQQAVERGLPIHEGLQDQPWGHRSFCVREPNGLILYFFRETGSAKHG